MNPDQPLCLVKQSDSSTPKNAWNIENGDQCSALDLSVKAKEISVNEVMDLSSERSPRKCLLTDFLSSHEDDLSDNNESFISSVSTSRRHGKTQNCAKNPSSRRRQILNQSCGYLPRLDTSYRAMPPPPAHTSSFNNSIISQSMSESNFINRSCSYTSPADNSRLAYLNRRPLNTTALNNSRLSQYDEFHFRKPAPLNRTDASFLSQSVVTSNLDLTNELESTQESITVKAPERGTALTEIISANDTKSSENDWYISPRMTRSLYRNVYQDSQPTSNKTIGCDRDLKENVRKSPKSRKQTRKQNKTVQGEPVEVLKKKTTTGEKDDVDLGSKTDKRIDEKSTERVLKSWYIRPINNMKAIMVEGVLLSHSSEANHYWKSTNIVERIRNCRVKTSNGSVYKLKGKIAKTISIANGFSRETVEAFHTGFPENWEKLIAKHFETEEEKNSSKQKKRDDHTKALPKKKGTQTQRRIAKSSFFQKKEDGGLEYNLLPKTRSGRAVKPLLNYWEGERVFMHPRTFTVQILNNSGVVSSSSPCTPEETKEKKKVKRIHKNSCSNTSEKITNSTKNEKKSTEKQQLSEETATQSVKQKTLETEIKSKKRKRSYTSKNSTADTSESESEKPAPPERKTKRRKLRSSIDEKKKGNDSESSDDSKLFVPKKSKNTSQKNTTVTTSKRVHKTNVSFMECLNQLNCHENLSTTIIDEDTDGKAVCLTKQRQSLSTDERWKTPRFSANGLNNIDGGEGRMKSHMNNRSCKKRNIKTILKTPGGTDVPWRKEEIDRLHRAIKTVAPCQESFWEEIADIVSTKTAEQCVQFHFKDVPNTLKSKPVKKFKSAAVNDKTVKQHLAGRGTLKRKKQLREFLEKQDEDHQDDFFDSTPLKNLLNTYKTSGLVDDNDSPLPMVNRTPFVPGLRFMPVSEKKTPAYESPGLLNISRDWAEDYVHKVLKERKLNHRHKTFDTSKTPAGRSKYKKDFNLPEPSKALFTVTEREDDTDEDSDEDKDYYWSDYDKEEVNLYQ